MSAFPILYVADVERAAAFYERAFGFERTYRWEDDYIALRRGDSHLGLVRGEGRGGFELCIYVDDVDGTAALLRSLGAREIDVPADQPWGERMAHYDDPEGHRLLVTMKL